MADDYRTYCTDCKQNTVAVFDHATGDNICSDCGLVLESRCIDDMPEWRLFQNDSNDNDNDPIRVGHVIDPFLPSNLHTVISNTNTKHKHPSPLLANRGSHVINSGAHFLKAFASITNIADKLSLIPAIINRAKEIYTKAVPCGDRKPRNHDALIGACVYMACNIEGLPRTVKEICTAANGVSKKDLGRAKAVIVKQLSDCNDGQAKSLRASDIVRRFCSNVGLTSGRVLRAAQEAAVKIEEVDIRRSPASVAAAIVCVIAQLSQEKQWDVNVVENVANATGVAQGTIKNACKDLYPHMSKIIPAWFSKPDHLTRLFK